MFSATRWSSLWSGILGLSFPSTSGSSSSWISAECLSSSNKKVTWGALQPSQTSWEKNPEDWMFPSDYDIQESPQLHQLQARWKTPMGIKVLPNLRNLFFSSLRWELESLWKNLPTIGDIRVYTYVSSWNLTLGCLYASSEPEIKVSRVWES